MRGREAHTDDTTDFGFVDRFSRLAFAVVGAIVAGSHAAAAQLIEVDDFQKPCDTVIFQPAHYSGSGICTGNNELVIPLHLTGIGEISLVYNSVYASNRGGGDNNRERREMLGEIAWEVAGFGLQYSMTMTGSELRVQGLGGAWYRFTKQDGRWRSLDPTFTPLIIDAGAAKEMHFGDTEKVVFEKIAAINTTTWYPTAYVRYDRTITIEQENNSIGKARLKSLSDGTNTATFVYNMAPGRYELRYISDSTSQYKYDFVYGGYVELREVKGQDGAKFRMHYEGNRLVTQFTKAYPPCEELSTLFYYYSGGGMKEGTLYSRRTLNRSGSFGYYTPTDLKFEYTANSVSAVFDKKRYTEVFSGGMLSKVRLGREDGSKYIETVIDRYPTSRTDGLARYPRSVETRKEDSSLINREEYEYFPHLTFPPNLRSRTRAYVGYSESLLFNPTRTLSTQYTYIRGGLRNSAVTTSKLGGGSGSFSANLEYDEFDNLTLLEASNPLSTVRVEIARDSKGAAESVVRKIGSKIVSVTEYDQATGTLRSHDDYLSGETVRISQQPDGFAISSLFEGNHRFLLDEVGNLIGASDGIYTMTRDVARHFYGYYTSAISFTGPNLDEHQSPTAPVAEPECHSFEVNGKIRRIPAGSVFR